MMYARYWSKLFENHKYFEWTPVTFTKRYWGHRVQEVVVFPDGTMSNKSNVLIKEG